MQRCTAGTNGIRKTEPHVHPANWTPPVTCSAGVNDVKQQSVRAACSLATSIPVQQEGAYQFSVFCCKRHRYFCRCAPDEMMLSMPSFTTHEDSVQYDRLMTFPCENESMELTIVQPYFCSSSLRSTQPRERLLEVSVEHPHFAQFRRSFLPPTAFCEIVCSFRCDPVRSGLLGSSQTVEC